MLGFVDESGDTGLRFDRVSSTHFVVSMVLFESEEDVAEVDRCIRQLKVSLRKPAMEFKFGKSSDAEKEKFFEAVKECKFQVVAVAVDKQKLEAISHEDLLKASFGLMMERAKDAGLLKEANLKFDDTGSKVFKKELASFLLKQVNGAEPGKYIKRFSPQVSHGNNLIQLADMVCGAIARPYNSPRKEGNYLTRFKHRNLSVPVLEYPETVSLLPIGLAERATIPGKPSLDTRR